ncbi:polysaccharide pyruvyl transferase family protein [Elioraea sp.]|uniref:polysaccharide pyruvyl transferase family protein n=1 Tax=Elioraea sp. TaxID=2185103 RepID=UPI0025BE2CB7|nr:polysaccharide pyruvyl transferase family protein [Elioraea sp.]
MTEILLYLAVPAASEHVPFARSPKGRVRSAVMQLADRARWRLLRDWCVTFDSWCRFEHSNKGDAAIRAAIREQVGSVVSNPRFIEVEWGRLDASHVARLNASQGLFVLAGSGYLHFGRDDSIAPRVVADLALMEQITCPRIAYGIGVNQFRGDGTLRPFDPAGMPEQTRETLPRLAGMLDIVSVRDRTTEALLASLAPGRVHLTGDPALFLAPRLRQASLADAPPLVGLNFALHGPESARSFPQRMRWIVPFVRGLRDTWGCRFRYMIHSDVERVFPLILRGEGIEVEVVDGDVDALTEGYAGIDLHICQMLHSSILSLGAGVPTLNIGYDAKNLEFFSLMGVPEYCVAPRDAAVEHLLSLANQLRKAAGAFAETVAVRKAKLAASKDACLDAIRAVVDAQNTHA